MLGRRMKRPTEYSPETRQPRSTSWRMLADTATVGSWTAAVKVAGAVKVILAARLFGAGDAMDAFLIAFLLPSFFMDLLAGPLDSALIPALIELRQKQGRAAAEVLYSNVLAAAGAAFVIAALLAAAISGFVLPLLAPSFAPDKLALTESLLLVMIAVVPCGSLASTWRAVLNSEHQFAYSAAVPLITPIASIVAILAGGKQYGVMALAVATLVGGTLEAIAAGIGVKRAGYPMIPHWAGVTASLRQVADQYVPLVAVTLVMTGTSLVDQGMAARLGSGSVSALNYGTRLLGVLIVIGPTAVGTAVLPHISVGAMLSDPRVLRRTLRTYGLAILAVILPATAGLMYFSEPIIRVLFQQGAFTETAAHLVSMVQRASLLQLPIAVLLALEIRLTSALKANHLLYRVAALSLALTLILDYTFMRWWGVVGIALAGFAIRLVSSLYLSCKISLARP
ncbi:MAG TPA: lipid II flippase MurJ [Bryobacteraceae bacterium]|nr:lipid II flippase MurJ [Bryobacteraceae bacterium]